MRVFISLSQPVFVSQRLTSQQFSRSMVDASFFKENNLSLFVNIANYMDNASIL